MDASAAPRARARARRSPAPRICSKAGGSCVPVRIHMPSPTSSVLARNGIRQPQLAERGIADRTGRQRDRAVREQQPRRRAPLRPARREPAPAAAATTPRRAVPTRPTRHRPRCPGARARASAAPRRRCRSSRTRECKPIAAVEAPIITSVAISEALRADAIAHVAEQRRADRARREPDEVRAEREQHADVAVVRREELRAGTRAPPRRRTERSRTTRSPCRRPTRRSRAARARPRSASLTPACYADQSDFRYSTRSAFSPAREAERRAYVS